LVDAMRDEASEAASSPGGVHWYVDLELKHSSFGTVALPAR
jgi:hypothetical protein